MSDALGWPAVSAHEAKLHGLAKDEAWVEAHAVKAAKLFPNQAMMPVATLMACCDKGAIDYLNQAPVLVLAAVAGKRVKRTSDRLFYAHNWKAAINGRRKLRDIMRLYGLPVQLRALKASALSPRKWRAVQELAKIAPSSLAQIIPAKRQASWLSHLADIVAQLDRRQRVEPEIFEWIARALADEPPHRLSFGPLDFLLASPDHFNPRWTWRQLSARSDEWHARVFAIFTEKEFFAKHGKRFDEEVPCAPFPERAEVENRLFIPLRTGADLYGEGLVLHHCVGTYSPDLLSGAARIVSVRDLQGKRIATAEFRVNPRDRPMPVIDHTMPDAAEMQLIERNGPIQTGRIRYVLKWQMVQIKAYCNADPDAHTVGATMRYGQMVREIDKAGGYTSFQMQSAPRGALFLWNGDPLDYPCGLANKLGRFDLLILPAESGWDAGFFQRVMMERTPVVIDHRVEKTEKNALAFQAAELSKRESQR